MPIEPSSLRGHAFEEVDGRKLEVRDPCHPVVGAIRAVRAD
jgi:hypothetical protein